MSRDRRQGFFAGRRRMAGLSLIEMMIALIMALIVAAGIVSVFASTSSSNKVQAQMAALQEEGRFAIHSLRTDLADANGTYCSNTGGNAGGTTSGLFLDSLRSPTIYGKTAISFTDNTVTLAAPTQAYSLPSSIFMRGYDCDASTCTPVDPNASVSTIPAMGKAVGDRVPGAAVLTMRYLKPGSGWAIVPSGSTGSKITAGSDGSVTTITLDKLAGEPDPSTFTGKVALLADCSNGQVFEVTNASGVLTPNNNYADPRDITQSAAPRVYDFSKDFQTVTYYLRVACVNGGSPCTGPTTGELVRRVNGVDSPLVRGIERLDFLYGIIDANGNTKFLTANEVDTATDSGGGSIPCPPGVAIDGGMGDSGCLWRAVKTVQVNILMDGQTPMYTLTADEMKYIYSPDGNIVPVDASSHDIRPNADQGFPKELLRREFTTLVSLRNFNP